jgi:hypothetical protein
VEQVLTANGKQTKEQTRRMTSVTSGWYFRPCAVSDNNPPQPFHPFMHHTRRLFLPPLMHRSRLIVCPLRPPQHSESAPRHRAIWQSRGNWRLSAASARRRRGPRSGRVVSMRQSGLLIAPSQDHWLNEQCQVGWSHPLLRRFSYLYSRGVRVSGGMGRHPLQP